MTAQVLIREVGAREGFQTLSHVIPTEQKVELINALSQTGVREIEVASFVRADRLPQMADGEQVAATFERRPGVEYLGLYLNVKGFERAEATGRLDNRGWIYTAVSDQFLRSNNNTSREEISRSVPAWVELFIRHGKCVHGIMISTAFGYLSEGRFDAAMVLESLTPIVQALSHCGQVLREISLADTIGIAVPDQVRRTVAAVSNKYPGVNISLHLHDTRGSGLANAYAGYLEGVRIFESSVGGLGGCPFAPGASGNIVTEDLVELLEGQGISTGISLERYLQVAHLAERLTGVRLPGKMMRNCELS